MHTFMLVLLETIRPLEFSSQNVLGTPTLDLTLNVFFDPTDDARKSKLLSKSRQRENKDFLC